MRVFLVGFMGCGKSYWGAIWAAENGLHFYDLDEMIVEKERRSIQDIFEQEGEDYFRKTESEVLKETNNLQNSIIACGGGTACFFDNIAWMKEQGVVVFINENVEKIIDNLKNEKQIRPLLFNLSETEKLSFVKQKLSERMPFYLQSEIVLASNDINEAAFMKIINYRKTGN